MIITIDGPTASGKSTTARELAQQLHFFYINSGLLYRSLAFLALKQFSLDKLTTLTSEQIIPLRNQLTYQGSKGKSIVLWNDKNITPLLKNPKIDEASSFLGTNKHAREIVLQWQKALVNEHKNNIVEGRDAGSTVFSSAEYKFFLTAKPEIRAERWHKDQKTKGNEFTLEAALQFVKDRDERDTKRAIAPLIIPKDALVIDNSEKDIKQTVEEIKRIIDGE